MKAHEDIDALREQYDNSVREYDKLQEEHRILQVNHDCFWNSGTNWLVFLAEI